MSEDKTKGKEEQTSNDVNFEEYEELLQRPLTDAERDFLQEIKAARDEEKRELSEPQIIRELDRTAKTREDADKKAVSSLSSLASGRTRGETNGGRR